MSRSAEFDIGNALNKNFFECPITNILFSFYNKIFCISLLMEILQIKSDLHKTSRYSSKLILKKVAKR